MNRSQKKRAEKFMRILDQAHGEIKKAAKRGEKAVVLELLGQCQAGSIELGTAIEAEEGEGFVTVRLLENYCEILYRLYEKIRLDEPVNAEKEEKNLQKARIRIENSVRNDIIAKKEVVFLPYKASMWDSLESVWKAADEDPDCRAYVIPIPYYDRREDGSFGDMHYEGDRYPDYVPVTGYGDYDFEGRQPDAIFIHNPYDECNYVTSVHPFFYSKNLKKFTERLVYIPYFIIKDEVPEHYCMLPGVIHADKIYVHSERAAEVYRENLSKFMNGKEMRRKIVGIGSPKMDRVREYETDGAGIPEPWKDLLSHAEERKIILYNTHLNGLMAVNERVTIEKIKNTLAWFQNRKDLLLWWRPHPLSLATVRAMNPGAEGRYVEIVEKYKAEAWGIYDDTEDLNRAIAFADAYFGDTSSVVLLFKQTGKPILLQNRRVGQEIRA
ncbi:MAG: hypothetical protein HFI93_08140 [Lachnospiraceae bacterium]|nr:hypothetical protein [Lachnospiraceae bacterium]